MSDKTFVPFEPLNIKMVKLPVPALCCVQETLEFDEAGEMPEVQPTETPGNIAKIESAKQAIDAAFAGILSTGTCSTVERVKELIDVKSPKPLPEDIDVSDAVVERVVERVLKSLTGKVAVIKAKETVEGCCGEYNCYNYQAGDTINILEFPAGSTSDSGNAGGSDNAGTGENGNTNETEDQYANLPDTAKDGVLEDLVGVVEVVRP